VGLSRRFLLGSAQAIALLRLGVRADPPAEPGRGAGPGIVAVARAECVDLGWRLRSWSVWVELTLRFIFPSGGVSASSSATIVEPPIAHRPLSPN
jgi:hypothetical protein